MANPVFLLAFAYHPDEALPQVANELKAIDRLLTATAGEAKTIWQVTQNDLEIQFDRNRDVLRLFHFSGHAGPNGLQLNRDGQTAQLALVQGLAGLTGMAKALRLVFLNGCSTEGQAQAFLDQGIPAVIATTKPLLDRYAIEFARRFYENFTRPNSRNTLKQAFEAAFYGFIAEHGSLSREMLDEKVRGNFDLDEDANEPLYALQLHPAKKSVADERFADWLVMSDAPDNSALKKKVQDLIAAGRLEEGLVQLASVLPDAVQLQAQFSAAKRENNLGLLDTGEWFKLQNQISYRALDFLKTL